ncbi:MAG: hypothetical protein AVW05_01465 [Hadesarchaea archaeon DG-33]|nr:MAG: hypothetical protein AVW05_01465 [Hadesarchaea archaeon DG-33]
MQRALALGMVVAIGVLLVFTVSTNLLPFGSFPSRQIGENFDNSIGQQILENAPQQTGAANVVTSVVWGYRGYDTLGEATVLFTAVVGVVMIFRAFGRRE